MNNCFYFLALEGLIFSDCIGVQMKKVVSEIEPANMVTNTFH